MSRIPFTCAYDEDAGMLIVSGELDEAGARELREQLAALIAVQSRDLVMDLSSIDSLPSSAIGAIAAARAHMRAHFLRLELVAAQDSIACRVLPRAGMAVRVLAPH